MENPTAPSKPPVMLYTEQTPNPESLKFVTNQMLFARNTADFREEDKELAKTWSPLAQALFELPWVKGVYICNNFVTITKTAQADWQDYMLEAKSFLKKYLESGQSIILEGFEEARAALQAENQTVEAGEDGEIVQKIKDLIDKYVRPAVEMDGGNIVFRAFRQGVVEVELQGSCSGCPSSSVTLKSGIEGMLKRMIPEVREVQAFMG